MNKKEAKTEYPVHELIATRWSGRAYKKDMVDDNLLKTVFEAARWAPSAYNEQPWRFIIVKNGSGSFDKIYQSLVKLNKVWAKNAPVLVIATSKRTFSHNQALNSHYTHDLGLAMGNILLQATYLKLNVHIMAGFEKKEIEQEFKIPEDYQVITIFSIGYLDSPDILPEDLKQRETAERIRKRQDNFVFFNDWGKIW